MAKDGCLTREINPSANRVQRLDKWQWLLYYISQNYLGEVVMTGTWLMRNQRILELMDTYAPVLDSQNVFKNIAELNDDQLDSLLEFVNHIINLKNEVKS